jgi:ABC-2 type transport system ATP-binding protein
MDRAPHGMITVTQLGKRYGDLVAVDGVTFTAEPGTIFGLLGPNGAGKSTTIGCISGLLKPTTGRVTVLGHDVMTDSVAARQRLGIVPQELALYEDLSAKENLSYWGAAYGMTGDALKRRVLEVLERLGLGDRAKEPVKRFSGGMKRRLNFGCGIVHSPKVLLLDEPTVGVDPQSRVRLLELVQEEVGTGTCVLYTTHYMEEAQDLCTRLAIIDHGKLLAMGTLDELRRMIGEKDIVRLSGRFDVAAVRRALEQAGGVEIVSADERMLRLAAEGASRRLPVILSAVTGAGGELLETSLSQPSLESLFIKLTGRELRE